MRLDRATLWAFKAICGVLVGCALEPVPASAGEPFATGPTTARPATARPATARPATERAPTQRAATEEATTAGSWQKDPRLGGSRGILRYRVSRAPYEWVDTPAVLTLKDGSQMEAYFLEVYGDWFVFYVKETGRSWLKEEVPRSEVARVDFDQYLPRDPVEPRAIEAATKQPTPKSEILSGVFTGSQGRHTRWKITFRSEIDKYREFAEDATEYGVVNLESRFEQTAAKTRFEHGTRASGRYFLYAPGTVNNKEWVLILSEMVTSEIDRSPDIMWSTEGVPDETFILHFSRDWDSFELEWSNQGAWTWTALVRLPFRRVVDEPADVPASYRTLEGRTLDGNQRPAPKEEPSRRILRRGESLPDGALRGQPLLTRSAASAASAARASAQAGLLASEEKRPRRWQVDGWGRPSTYWSGRR